MVARTTHTDHRVFQHTIDMEPSKELIRARCVPRFTCDALWLVWWAQYRKSGFAIHIILARFNSPTQFSRHVPALHFRKYLNSEDYKMAKDHGPQIKDDERYEKFREKGMSKEKAARIANTPRSE